MIIKVINRKVQEKSHFERLGRYILNAKADNARMFQQMTEYVTDLKGGGQKVGWYRISNCYSDTPTIAIAEVLATQSRNTRTKADKTYHLVVSLPRQERLTQEQAADIEDTICAGLGFSEHQRISAVHRDTDHFHMHIAVSKIHPRTLRCIEPYYPHYKLDALAKELELKHALHQDNRIGKGQSFARAGAMEAQQNEESFLRWLHKNLGDRLKTELQQAQRWQDIHDLLGASGAVIKPRGAGLAIVSTDDKVGIKASSLDRSLSFKSLTARFGEYEPPQRQSRSRSRYEPDARKRAESQSLYADYQRVRQSSCEARTQALSELRASYKGSRLALIERYRQRRASVEANAVLDARTKRNAYHELSLERKQELDKLARLRADQKNEIREKMPNLKWDDYLVDQAQRGNVEALAVLRRRQNSRQEIGRALLTVETIEQARDIIKPQFKPTVLKNGTVVYRAKDGSVVHDQSAAISVKEVTEAATLLALSLADERFRGKALLVEGSDEFKLQVARLSSLEGLSIRFADAQLESERHGYARAAQQRSPEHGRQNDQDARLQQNLNSGLPYFGR